MDPNLIALSNTYVQTVQSSRNTMNQILQIIRDQERTLRESLREHERLHRESVHNQRTAYNVPYAPPPRSISSNIPLHHMSPLTPVSHMTSTTDVFTPFNNFTNISNSTNTTETNTTETNTTESNTTESNTTESNTTESNTTGSNTLNDSTTGVPTYTSIPNSTSIPTPTRASTFRNISGPRPRNIPGSRPRNISNSTTGTSTDLLGESTRSQDTRGAASSDLLRETLGIPSWGGQRERPISRAEIRREVPSMAERLRNYRLLGSRAPSLRSVIDDNILFANLSPVRVRPTSRDIVNATREIRFGDIENPLNTECPITREVFNADDRVMELNHCRHIFTANSLQRWFESSVRCPVCRHDIRNIMTSNSSRSRPTASSLSQMIYRRLEESRNTRQTSSDTNNSTNNSNNYTHTNASNPPIEVGDVARHNRSSTEETMASTEETVAPEEPVVPEESVASTSEPVASITEEPVAPEEPVASTEEHVAQTEEPVASTEEPVASTSEPVASTEEPVASTEEPVATTEEPVATTEEWPVVPTEEPGMNTRSVNVVPSSSENNRNDLSIIGRRLSNNNNNSTANTILQYISSDIRNRVNPETEDILIEYAFTLPHDSDTLSLDDVYVREHPISERRNLDHNRTRDIDYNRELDLVVEREIAREIEREQEREQEREREREREREQELERELEREREQELERELEQISETSDYARSGRDPDPELDPSYEEGV